MWITIDYVGLVDPSNGLDLSFWFSDEGELRRLTVEGDGDSGSSSYEYSSKLSVDSAPIDAPAAPRSWRQLRALHD